MANNLRGSKEHRTIAEQHHATLNVFKKIFAAALCALLGAASIFPVEGAIITQNIEIDLSSGSFYSMKDQNGNDGMQYYVKVPFPPMELKERDTLSLNISFSNSNNLTLSQTNTGFYSYGSIRDIERIFVYLNGPTVDGSLYGQHDYSYSLTLNNVSGDLLQNTFRGRPGCSSSTGICGGASVDANLTDTSFGFSGFTANITYSTISSPTEVLPLNSFGFAVNAGNVSIETPPPIPTLGLSGVFDPPSDKVIDHTNTSMEKPDIPGIPDTRKRNVAILVHGWNSNPEAWPKDSRAAIEKRLTALNLLCSTSTTVDPCWEVRTYDWSSVSGFTPSVLPPLAYVYAYVIGPRLAEEILDVYGLQLNHLHLIGHSAGANVINRAAKKFVQNKEQGDFAPKSLQLTFLDAYTPLPTDLLSYGDIDNSVIPNFSDSYLTSLPPLPIIADALRSLAGNLGAYYIWSQTAWSLNNAYNVGVSLLDQKTSVTAPFAWAIQDHAWPYQFYQCSANPSLDNFVNGGAGAAEPCPTNHNFYAFGFPLSLEYNPAKTVQGLRQGYKPGLGCTATSTMECVDVGANSKVIFKNTVNAVIDFTQTKISETGKALLKIGDKVYDLKQDMTQLLIEQAFNVLLHDIPKFELKSGSPVWVGLRVNIDKNANFLRFKFKFTQDGRGFLRAFIHGKEIWSADQRDHATGKTWNAEMGVGELGPGSYEIAFRLDPLTADQAAVELTEFEIANLQAVDAPNQSPIANAGLSRAVRQGSVVTLDGSASTDPDNAPAPLSFTWTKIAGLGTTLNNAVSVNPMFVPNNQGLYRFGLTVNDGADSSAPSEVAITVPRLGDIDLDGDVDNNDLNLILAARNKPASGPNDLRDLDGNMMIDALDSRKLTTLCTRARCATQ